MRIGFRRQRMERIRIRKTSGFTLLELLVVLVVGGSLLAVGVPAFQSIVADQRRVAYDEHDLIARSPLSHQSRARRCIGRRSHARGQFASPRQCRPRTVGLTRDGLLPRLADAEPVTLIAGVSEREKKKESID